MKAHMMSCFLLSIPSISSILSIACSGVEPGRDAGTADAGADAGSDAGPVDGGKICTDPQIWQGLPSSVDSTFKKGPYLMYTTGESIIVKWETDVSAASVVEYGATESLGMKATGADSVIHEVKLTGLDPGSAYHYRAGDGVKMSGILTARTAAPPGTPFRFAAYGDSQSNPEVHSKHVARIISDGVSFVVHTGDLGGDGREYEGWQTTFFGPTRPLAHRVPYFSAIGNHEKQSHWWFDFFSYPYPAGDQQHMRYYSYTWGDAFFVHLDGDLYIGTDIDPQHDFVKRALSTAAAKRAKYRVVAYHQPAWSEYWGGCDQDGDLKIRTNLVPLLEEKKVSLVLNGHTHNYQRMFLNGVTHITTGGGGGGVETQKCRDFDFVQKVANVHHYTLVEAGCSDMRIRAVDMDGNEIDSFSIPANPLVE